MRGFIWWKDMSVIPLMQTSFQPQKAGLVQLTAALLSGWEEAPKLSFFLTASITQCFTFVTKIMLMTYCCFTYFWTVLGQHESFSASHLPLQRAGGWVGQELGRDTAGNAADTQCCVIFCLAIKVGRKEEEGGTFVGITFVFPRYHHMCWDPIFLEKAGCF